MNIWDERYGAAGFLYGTEPNDFLKAEAGRIPPGEVLCLAEGQGRNAVYLARQGYAVTAVDASAVGLAKLEELARPHNLRIATVASDLARYEIEPGAWDAIVSIWCHVPPPVRRPLHAASVAGLKPGGWMILEAYHPRQLQYKTGGPPVPELTMTLEALRQELAGLEFVLAQELDREVHEGTGHHGKGAVVQVAARKGA